MTNDVAYLRVHKSLFSVYDQGSRVLNRVDTVLDRF